MPIAERTPMIPSPKATDVVIVGAGGHGSELHSYFGDLLAHGGSEKLLGFVDDNRPPGSFLDSEVLGSVAALGPLSAAHVGTIHYITAFGSNSVRHRMVRLIERLSGESLLAWTLRHPSAQLGHDVQVGPGSLLAPNVVVTTRVRIGVHSILNVRASVSHDCLIGDFVNINPAATLCGNVQVGDGSFIGAGAVVKEKIVIGRGVVVGAGAVVVRDLPDGVTVVGSPARVIKHATSEWTQV